MSSQKNDSAIPEIDLANYVVDQEAVNLIPASLAERYELMPLFKVGRTLTIAMSDPNNIVAIDQVRLACKMDVSIVRANPQAIKGAIAEYYGISGLVEEIVRRYPRPDDKQKNTLAVTEEAPIVKLVNAILSQSVKERASDIHIEPEAKDLRVRTRVDGVLHEELTMPLHMLAPIVSRVKVLAGMDIAESRIPQDGRFETLLEDKKIDFRVSTFPSAYGEKVVLRILDKSSISYRLPDIGFTADNLEKFRKVIHKPHGIVLVTGPTGSGKTTTLYAVLAEINNKDINITTIEDPIEYELEGITQAQVNVKAGLTFATALRAILRQDPDVVLIGEVRDLETAEIAVQSALTGHLVFSTLHTNDSVGAISRLQDMGVETYLIASSVEAVLAQRLVRKICTKCDAVIPVPQEYADKFPGVKELHKGKGCKSCRGTGYKGRLGIFELLVVDETIKKMISEKRAAEDIRAYAISKGMKTLFEDGLAKVRNGVTSLDEILRVTELE